MAVKLVTQIWREAKAEEQLDFKAGKITEEELCLEQLFPDQFIAETEPLLTNYANSISRVASANPADYSSVKESIQSLVVKLNAVNQKYDCAVIETGEREQLCQYIEDVITESAIDLDAYSAANKCDKNEITDEWRDW